MTDPHEAIRQTRLTCEVHKDHVPASHINEVHHVWPKGDGGPNIAENRIVVCATGHNNIHDLINILKSMQGKVPYSELRRYSYKERELAKLGYDRYTRGAM